MLFNSWQFFLFFPIVTGLYFLVPHRARWSLLLLASCFFYMTFIPVYILILATTIIVDYTAAILIEKSEGKKRLYYFVFSIISTCLILFFFKYYNFFTENVTAIATLLHWNYSIQALKIILPIGLSFHTFQSLSYVIEVYRGNQKAEHHFGIYSLYVMFYPQLVAGPIERPQKLLHQFRMKHDFEYDRVTSGLKLMAWGLFKKVVIADRLALFVNPIYNEPHNFSNSSLLIATVLFAFQIYCDFAGYSDIAVGTARVMGFDLMQNFNRPYSAKTLSEFWQRWHISLSSWLRDYVYDPIAIGFRYSGLFGIGFALIVTFLISGLWHGAAWTFVIWGLLHGFGLAIELMTSGSRKKIAKGMPVIFKTVSVTATFSFICFAYIFFRAKNIGDALYIAKNIFDGVSWSTINIIYSAFSLGSAEFLSGQSVLQFQIALLAILIMEVVQMKIVEPVAVRRFMNAPWMIRWSAYYALILTILLAGVWFSQREFIYFQF